LFHPRSKRNLLKKEIESSFDDIAGEAGVVKRGGRPFFGKRVRWFNAHGKRMEFLRRGIGLISIEEILTGGGGGPSQSARRRVSGSTDRLV